LKFTDDKSDFEDTVEEDGAILPVDNRNGDNFKSYDKLTARADMTKPDSVEKAVTVTLSAAGDKTYGNDFKVHSEKVKVQGPVALDMTYNSVYKNFDSQMQIGHVYGDAGHALLGTLARVSNVYVQGNSTAVEDMQYMKDLATVNKANGSDGMFKYNGVATYMEGLHLGDGDRAGPIVDGTSAFNVDFINGKVDGTLSFADKGDSKYMPKDNEIGISADINGNTFAGNVNNIDTAGGFYGEDAKFLGGIYQEAKEVGGKGTNPGEGTTFQGTFGAEKVTK
jgi:hypothetical protein